MTELTHHPAAVETDASHADAWTRTDSKHRRRAVIFLLVDLLLFAGLGCVAYWVREGVVFAPADRDYAVRLAETFNPTPETRHTPTGLSLGPINIRQVPIMIPVLGLILAALVSIPILVTMLYRLPSALPFVAVVGLVAVMPWLAIALLASCLLVSIDPFKIRLRFAAGLLALLPEILYFFLASRQTGSPVAPLTDPADQIKLVAPLILAIIASAVVMGIVLIIARVVNYRPGAIAPLLAILLLAPAALFEFHVGRDELHYRLLERDFGPGSENIVGEGIRHLYDAAAAGTQSNSMSGQVSHQTVRDTADSRQLSAVDAEAELRFTAFQDRAAFAAQRFVKLFPDSVYAPNALYIEGRALDMRIDVGRFREGLEPAFHDEFPSPRSKRAWQLVEHNAPHSPVAAEALLRLAILDARAGEVDRAVDRLDRLIAEFAVTPGSVDHAVAGASVNALMQRQPPEKSLDIPVAQKVVAAQTLRDLLDRNRDPNSSDAPLVELMRLDPHDPRYAENLRAILRKHPGCVLADNLKLRLAQSIPDVARRLGALEECASVSPEADSLPEAVYRLAVAHQENKDVAASRDVFNRVIREFPDSVWREQAEVRLRLLDRAANQGS